MNYTDRVAYVAFSSIGLQPQTNVGDMFAALAGDDIGYDPWQVGVPCLYRITRKEPRLTGETQEQNTGQTGLSLGLQNFLDIQVPVLAHYQALARLTQLGQQDTRVARVEDRGEITERLLYGPDWTPNLFNVAAGDFQNPVLPRGSGSPAWQGDLGGWSSSRLDRFKSVYVISDFTSVSGLAQIGSLKFFTRTVNLRITLQGSNL